MIDIRYIGYIMAGNYLTSDLRLELSLKIIINYGFGLFYEKGHHEK